MSPKHKAKALAISCIDFRFQEIINKDLASRGLNVNVDRIAWPGASKNLEEVTEAVKTSIRLHDPEEVFIYEHEDCGAYRDDNTEQTHKTNVQKLIISLKEIKPTLKFTSLIATFDGIKEF